MSYNIQDLPRLQVKHIIFKFDREIETDFYDDFFKNSLWYIRVALFLSFILVAAFGILDSWIVPINKNITWIIRYAILCPSLLICIVLTFFKFFRHIMQFMMSFECFLVGLGFAAMIAIAQESEPGFKYYYVGLIQVIVAGHVLLRIRFVYASIISWLLIIMYEFVSIYFNGMLSTPELVPIFINNNFFFLSTTAMCMIANFFIEYYIRNDFLLRKRIQYEEEQKTLQTKEELLKTRLERDYAKQTILSIEQETDTGLRTIAHSIKNKHMIQDARNKSINENFLELTELIDNLKNDIPRILDKTCYAVMNKYKEKILLQIKKISPEIYETLVRDTGFFDSLKKTIVQAFRQKNSRKVTSYLLSGITRSTDTISQALSVSFSNMIDILNYIYAIIAYQRGKAVKTGENVFTDLEKVFWHIHRTYKKDLTEYNISFNFENHTGEDVLLRIYDFIMEEDIIRNLFVNSFRVLVENDPETKQDDKVIWVSVFPGSQDNGDHFYTIHFRDNGPGVPDDKKEAIFMGYSSKQKEYIVKHIETEVEHGVGLLTVRKRITEAGGSIHEEGVYGKGAHFVMTLRKYTNEKIKQNEMDLKLKDDEVFRVQHSEETAALFAGKNLLIVDDDKTIAKAVGSIFNDTGIEITYAHTVDEARNRIFNQYRKPDAIILDLDIGAHRGEDILVEMMATHETIPVIVVSGSDRAYHIDRLKSLGAHSVHQKPVKEKELFLLVKKVLLDEKADQFQESTFAGSSPANE
jgi:CheY-like chemotaxis protein/signal transduction histidine kinase